MKIKLKDKLKDTDFIKKGDVVGTVLVVTGTVVSGVFTLAKKIKENKQD